MVFLAWVLIITAGIFCGISLWHCYKTVRSRFSTPEDLIKTIAQKGGPEKGSPEKLRQLFHCGFEQILDEYALSDEMWKRVQCGRVRTARECIRSVGKVIDCLERMAQIRWEKDGALSENEMTKALAKEMKYRAARCRILVRYLRIRLAITAVCDSLLHKVTDPGMSEICEAVGDRLTSEYEQLVGASLAFCRRHGEHYYEILLFALESMVVLPPEESRGQSSV